AADYLPKNFEDISRHPEKVRQLLCERVHALARSNRRSLGLGAAAAPVASSAPASARQPLAPRAAATAPAPAPAEPVRRSAAPRTRSYKLVAIGTSTGGPVALQKILTRLPASFPAPRLLIQHMPGTFTTAFAERLDKLCQIDRKSTRLNSSPVK